MYAVMWSEHCSYKSSRAHLRRLPVHRRRGDGRAGRERRGDGRRRRHRRGHPHREPQPPELHRAGPGRGHRGGRHPARHLHDGRPPDRVDGPAPFRAAGRRPEPVGGRRGRVRHLRLRQLGRVCPPSAARSTSTRATPATRWSTSSASAPCPTSGSCSGRRRASATSRCCSARPPGATASVGCRCWPRPASRRATTTSGRRCRWATRSRRSGSSRRAWPCSTPASSSASRTSAAPASPARPARPRRGATSGMDVDVSAVPCREPGMEPFEVMTSESQERMLAIVTPEGIGEVLDLCARWEVQATVIGRVTEAGSPRAGRLRILDGFDGPVLADVPAASLHDDAPVYDRPLAPPDPARLGPSPVAGSGPPAASRAPRPAVRHARGSGASTTTSSSSTRWSARAATRCCCGSSTRPPAPTPAAGWPSRPTATTGGARSTRRPAPASSWPRP